MCRWIAYRGEPIALEHYVTQPAHSLISQSIRALQATAGTNGDGFGLGWYGDHPEPGLYRDLRPAWADENLRYLCRHIRSHLFFGHVRSSTGTAVTRPNCHPFACGVWMFMHNGFVGNWDALRRHVEELIPDDLYPRRLGTTDSEAVFLAMMGQGVDNDPIGATARTLTALSQMATRNGAAYALRFTSALTNGRDLYAFRFSVNDAANTLYFRSNPTGTAIVSEPLDENHKDWIEVPPNHVVVARADKPVEVLPFLDRRQVAAE
jgi:predicted glutamine amidotransferase